MKHRGYMESCSIAAPGAAVWRALVDPVLLTRWLAAAVTVEPRPGGLYRFDHAHAGRREAHIDVFEPPRRLRLIHFVQADWPAAADAAPVDDVMVVQRDTSTVVRIMGSGVPADPAWDLLLRRWRGSWAVSLVNLKKMLEGHSGPHTSGPA
jgi:uncharacterized protein YndB with AHSA1/START domain